ncbi:hypothetical protein MMC13_003527 [Lambiella insularis]|nr:hypothetical protein [Lambiella insularis]
MATDLRRVASSSAAATSNTDMLSTLPAAPEQEFRFLELPRRIRLLILEELLKRNRAIRVYEHEPEPGTAPCPYPYDFVALRSTCNELRLEAGFQFMSLNKFFVSSCGDITYFARKLDEFHCLSVKHLILGKNALSVSADQDRIDVGTFHAIRVLAALRSFPNLDTLTITLPWAENGLSNPDFGNLMDFIAVSGPTRELVICRPDIEFLLPGNTGSYREYRVPDDASQHFLSCMLADHPKGYKYPENARAILVNDTEWMNRLNERNERYKEPLRVRASIETVQLRRWLMGYYEPYPGMVWQSTMEW